MTRLTEKELDAIAQSRASGTHTLAASEQVTNISAAQLRRLAERERALVMRAMGRRVAAAVRGWVIVNLPALPRAAARRRTEIELSQQSDEVLRDIGITRIEIPGIARAQAEKMYPRKTRGAYLVPALARWQIRRRVRADLERLDDAILWDIGITRMEIPRIARMQAEKRVARARGRTRCAAA